MKQLEAFKEKIAKTLVAERERAGLTQTELAFKAKVSRQTIGKIENKDIVPTLYTMHRISKGLGIPLSEFVSIMRI